MGETTISVKKYVLKYGLILGILSIFYGIGLYISNKTLHRGTPDAIIEFVILMSVVSYGIYAFKTDNDRILTLGDALKIGLGISLIGGIVPFAWQFLLMNVIEPDMLDQILELRKKVILKSNPNISTEKLSENLAMTKMFNTAFMTSVFSLIYNLLFGSVLSLLAGAIMQKNRDPFD